MRIRDRLFAPATAALHQGRSAARDSAGRADGDSHGSDPSAELPLSELPREVGEQMLQSVMSSQQRLHQTSEALASIGSALVRAEAGLRAAPPAPRALGTPTPRGHAVVDRAAIERARGSGDSFAAVLGFANARGIDGGFLFAGGEGGPPFAHDGSFRGAPSNAIIMIVGSPPALVISGSALTASGTFALAVDVLPALARALTSATIADPRERERCSEQLRRATLQVTFVQSKLAQAIAVLADATSVLEDALANREGGGEPDGAPKASQLAQTFGAIEAARSLAERTLAIFPTLT